MKPSNLPRRTWAAAVLALAACASTGADAAGQEPSFPRPFVAEMDSVFGLDVHLRGVADRRGDTLVVRVDSSRLQRRSDSGWPFNQPAGDSIRVALATGSRQESWELRETSQPVLIASLREPGGTSLRHPVTFRIPLPAGRPLADRWLVFVFAQTSPGRAVGYSYAHASTTDSLREGTSATFRPGQRWAYRHRALEPRSTLTILRVDRHPQLGTIVHVRIEGLKIRNPQDPSQPVDLIAHIPFSESALLGSVTAVVRERMAVPDFSGGYAQWRRAQERGSGGIFTVSVAEAVDVVEEGINR